jgi:hypothetical protein
MPQHIFLPVVTPTTQHYRKESSFTFSTTLRLGLTSKRLARLFVVNDVVYIVISRMPFLNKAPTQQTALSLSKAPICKQQPAISRITLHQCRSISS